MASLTRANPFAHWVRHLSAALAALMTRLAHFAALVALVCLATFVGAHTASAAETDMLSVAAGGGTMISLPEPAVAVFVADPDIADVHVPTPRSVFVLGKKAGT